MADNAFALVFPPKKAAMLPFPPGCKVTVAPTVDGIVESAFIDLSPESNRESQYIVLLIDRDNNARVVTVESKLSFAAGCSVQALSPLGVHVYYDGIVLSKYGNPLAPLYSVQLVGSSEVFHALPATSIKYRHTKSRMVTPLLSAFTDTTADNAKSCPTNNALDFGSITKKEEVQASSSGQEQDCGVLISGEPLIKLAFEELMKTEKVDARMAVLPQATEITQVAFSGCRDDHIPVKSNESLSGEPSFKCSSMTETETQFLDQVDAFKNSKPLSEATVSSSLHLDHSEVKKCPSEPSNEETITPTSSSDAETFHGDNIERKGGGTASERQCSTEDKQPNNAPMKETLDQQQQQRQQRQQQQQQQQQPNDGEEQRGGDVNGRRQDHAGTPERLCLPSWIDINGFIRRSSLNIEQIGKETDTKIDFSFGNEAEPAEPGEIVSRDGPLFIRIYCSRSADYSELIRARSSVEDLVLDYVPERLKLPLIYDISAYHHHGITDASIAASNSTAAPIIVSVNWSRSNWLGIVSIPPIKQEILGIDWKYKLMDVLLGHGGCKHRRLLKRFPQSRISVMLRDCLDFPHVSVESMGRDTLLAALSHIEWLIADTIGMPVHY